MQTQLNVSTRRRRCTSARVTIEIDLVTFEFFEDEEDFAQIPTDDLDDVDVAGFNVHYSPTGATITASIT